MRVFIASLATETNTFAPFPTGRAAYEEYGISRTTSTEDGLLSGAMATFRRECEARGHEVIESIGAFAQPAGRTVRSVYEGLRDEILTDLHKAGSVDVVLFSLHGAMVADGYDDCEGDILSRARQIVPAAVIGLEIDPHCHLTATMLEAADVIVIYKEYPHVDISDRARELTDLCLRTARGEIEPVAAVVDTRIVGFYPTFDPPMSEVVADLRAIEQKGGLLSASVAHGFPWADVADVGTRVLVYADGDPERAGNHATAVARRLYELRATLQPSFPGIAESLARAATLTGRVVLGDFADNPGGGAPGDSTFFLREMLERGCVDAAIGVFWDPLVASTCADAGVGARLDIRLGGKAGRASGDPIDLQVEVCNVVENHSEACFGNRQALGRSVWLRTGGIDIAVASIRAQTYAEDAFTGLGIRLDDKRLVVVKSSNHYVASFRPNAAHLWHVSSPGAMSLDFAQLPYTKRDGDYFPRVADPWATRGTPAPRIFRKRTARVDTLSQDALP